MKRNTPSSDALKVRDSSRKKKIPKRVPCFTPLLKMNRQTALCPSCPHGTKISQPTCISSRRLKRPFLLTRSNTLVRSVKAIYKGCFCSRDFSCSCLSVQDTSMVDLCALKLLHCHSVRADTFSKLLQSLQSNPSECLPHDT